MPKWKPVTPPLIMRADNGSPYQADRGLADQLLLKGIEVQCLVDICQRQATVIATQEKVVKLLEERLYQALNRFHPLQKKGATHA